MFLYLRILVLFFLFSSLEASKIETKVQSIPLRDREKIEQLFSHFVSREGFGFALFKQTKPACMISLPLTHKNYVMPYKVDNPLRFQRDLATAWRVWSYHSHLFKHPEILFCEEYQRINGGMYLQLFVINKKSAELILENYRDDFAEVLGDNFTPQKFLTKLEKKRKLRPLIRGDDKLLGLLLGFGRESSAAFQKMVFAKDLDSPLGKIGKRQKGCCITPVSFRGNPDSLEVKALVESYSVEIIEIEDIFKKDSFLITVLEKFCSSPSSDCFSELEIK